jgi:hypothetical protein
MMTHHDAFISALRRIHGAETTKLPGGTQGHLYTMKIHGYIEVGSGDRYYLTEEGRQRAYPKWGDLRVTVQTVRKVGWDLGAREVLYKTRAARESLRHAWYTPKNAKDVEGRPEP